MWRDELRTSSAVAIGGVIGATARWAVGSQLAPDLDNGFPWHTFTVNVVGCLLIGLVSTRIRRPSIGWSFIATGILGGFTTMSSFAVELNDLADAGATRMMLTYLVATMAVSLGAFIIARVPSGPVDDLAEGPEVIG